MEEGSRWKVSHHHHLRCSGCRGNTLAQLLLLACLPLFLSLSKNILNVSFFENFLNMTYVHSHCEHEFHQIINITSSPRSLDTQLLNHQESLNHDLSWCSICLCVSMLYGHKDRVCVVYSPCSGSETRITTALSCHSDKINSLKSGTRAPTGTPVVVWLVMVEGGTGRREPKRGVCVWCQVMKDMHLLAQSLRGITFLYTTKNQKHFMNLPRYTVVNFSRFTDVFLRMESLRQRAFLMDEELKWWPSGRRESAPPWLARQQGD